MRIAEQYEARTSSIAGTICALAAVCIFTAAPALAQGSSDSHSSDSRSGVSHPPSAPILADDDPLAPKPAIMPAAKPSPAVPMTGAAKTPPAGSVIPAGSGEVYGAYVPYRAPGAAAAATTQTSAAAAFDPDAGIVTQASIKRAEQRDAAASAAAGKDSDAGIVTHVVSPPGEVAEGTLVKARLGETISTQTTMAGTRFTAVLSTPVMRDGQVIVPAGATLEGRVTSLHSGTRFNGGAVIHLEPRSITLPDGSAYILRARVIDTGSWDKTTVDEEGTIEHRGNGKKAAAGISLAAGGGMAAGAMMGGVPGALIGAGVGAGAATVVWLRQDRQAELPRDLELVFSLTEPMSIQPIGAFHTTATVEKPTNRGGE